jgi:hypothetical protein
MQLFSKRQVISQAVMNSREAMDDFHKIPPKYFPVFRFSRLPCVLKVLSKIAVIAEFYDNVILLAVAEACKV